CVRCPPQVRPARAEAPAAKKPPLLCILQSPEFRRFGLERPAKKIEDHLRSLLYVRPLKIEGMDNRGHRLGLARLLLVERGLPFLKLLPLRNVPGYDHQQLLPILARPQYPSL